VIFFALYLNIHGLQKGPGKLFMGSWKVLDFFVGKRVGTVAMALRSKLCWSRTLL